MVCLWKLCVRDCSVTKEYGGFLLLFPSLVTAAMWSLWRELINWTKHARTKMASVPQETSTPKQGHVPDKTTIDRILNIYLNKLSSCLIIHKEFSYKNIISTWFQISLKRNSKQSTIYSHYSKCLHESLIFRINVRYFIIMLLLLLLRILSRSCNENLVLPAILYSSSSSKCY